MPKRKARAAPPKSGPATHDLLIEIGTEEMPANYLAYADDPENDLFRKKFEEVLARVDESRAIQTGELQIFLTPRRIILRAPALAFDPAPKKEPVYGPSVAQAYGPDGKPAPALLGFMKSKGITEKDLERFDNKGKECVGYWKTEKPRPLADVLPEFLPLYLKALTFPKTMKWDASDVRFPRPIRTLLVLIDGKPLKFKVGLLATGNTTRLFLAGARMAVTVKSADAYFALLKKHGIVPCAKLRRAAIEKEVQRITKACGGIYEKDEALLAEVTYLSERPVVISGKFDTAYQDLPREVLHVSLSKKQRLFSIVDSKGKHLPHFAAVLEGPSSKPAEVASTIAAILRAKLQDSHFFYEEDAKVYRRADGAAKHQSELKNLVFLKDMGTMAEKGERLERTARAAAKGWGLNSEEEKALARASGLSKTDLLTQMVGEFPELQGIMGGYYLGIAGESTPVSKAVAEQYLPASADGKGPSTRVGAALSILDKADLVTACFIIGKVPTSSQDPYALKRAVIGIIRNAVEHRLAVSWSALAGWFLAEFQKKPGLDPARAAALKSQLETFHRERLAYYFQHLRGFEPDLVAAVLETNSDSAQAASERLEALSALRRKPFFEKSVKVIERTSNILKSANGLSSGDIREDRLMEDVERDLFKKYEQGRAPILEAIGRKDFEKATSLYADTFFDILDVFFDKVLVNAPDEEVRRNRFCLLNAVRSLYTSHIADLSKVKTGEKN